MKVETCFRREAEGCYHPAGEEQPGIRQSRRMCRAAPAPSCLASKAASVRILRATLLRARLRILSLSTVLLELSQAQRPPQLGGRLSHLRKINALVL